MKRACELRQQAERYRRLKRQISDPAAVQAICDLVVQTSNKFAGQAPRLFR
jgi:Tn3 transposase DDE domain